MNTAPGPTIVLAGRANEIRAAMEKLKDVFVELQRGFSHFSVIAGLFSMAVVIETMVFPCNLYVFCRDVICGIKIAIIFTNEAY